MGFFNMMKRAMGFSSAEDDELEVEGIDATVTPLRQRALSAPQEEMGKQSAAETDETHTHKTVQREEGAQQTSDNPADASMIFEGVVEIFNEALPGFLRDSVDPDKQRKLLYESLDSSIKKYFEQLEKNVERKLHGRYQSESRNLQEQIEELRQKARKEEEGNSNAKNLQLSAERQKRALSERVHELEKQLASIEAENEQYILENKSMANKLRLAALTEHDSDVAARLEEADRKVAEAEGRLAAAQEALNLSETRISELMAAAESAGTAPRDDDRVAELEKELSVMRDSLEQAKAKDELSRAMVNDLNTRAAEARRVASEKEAQTASLQNDINNLNEQLTLVTARLTKAQEDLRVVREVQEQVAKLEESQRQNDAAIRRQKDELMEKDELIRIKDADILTKNATLRIKDETIRRLEDQTDSLRKSVETVQFEKTQTESALRSEIERLKALKGITASPATPAVAAVEIEPEIPVAVVTETPELDLTLDLPELVTPEKEAVATPRPRRGRPPKPRPEGETQPQEKKKEEKKVAAEADDSDFSLLDSTDWLIATPAPDAPKPKRQRKQKAESADDAFGYKEPVRQEPPDNPAQMLLW